MKYSKEIVQEICKYIEEGSNYEDAAALAGIGESTFYEWKQKKPEFVKADYRAGRGACRPRPSCGITIASTML
jgi:transposase